MKNPKYGINMGIGVSIDSIEIWTNKKLIKNITKNDLISGTCKKSPYKYVDIAIFRIHTHHYTSNINKGFEYEVKAYILNNRKRELLYHGYIYKIVRQWDKIKEIDSIEITCMSYTFILAENQIQSKEIKFKNGYGEVIKKLVSPLKIFNLENINLDDEKGSMFFDNISVLNALRFIAYSKGWCLRFYEKDIYFEKCKGLIDSGTTIKLSDIPQGRIEY